ncbi:hypothetical protein CLOSTASPAR_01443 [[Clostridium] asparagiforme DSM 15981]|uniref:Uncharacterized protein n=1 Tax=[Clostridium] asparagiforme DSM 15981 TaxID=518636 RepID=C0CWS2_9FIRM|nr:hypothetical protein CLOSTASPAR_01443 [[Clostridium] asparagiforme DSM 15981]
MSGRRQPFRGRRAHCFSDYTMEIFYFQIHIVYGLQYLKSMI